MNRLIAQRSEDSLPANQYGAPAAQPEPVVEPRDHVARVHVDGIEFTSLTSSDAFTPMVEGIDINKPLRPAPIDEKKWVAGIPRCCDTCRDFQRNADGRTGYCGNSYAFGRRTVVECDQLACRSSGSVWWLPSDDFWLDRAEIAHHTRPTPYLDAVLSELRSGSR